MDEFRNSQMCVLCWQKEAFNNSCALGLARHALHRAQETIDPASFMTSFALPLPRLCVAVVSRRAVTISPGLGGWGGHATFIQ